MNTRRLGDVLIASKVISKETLDRVLEMQKHDGGRLGELLVKKGITTEDEIIKALEIQLGIPKIVLKNHYINPEVPVLIKESMARRNSLIPLFLNKGILTIAMMDPLNIFAIEDVEIATGYKVRPVIATKDEILSSIAKYYGKQSAERAIEDFNREYTKFDISEEEFNLDVKNAPVVRLVDSIIRQGVKAMASDIHIEPFEDCVRVRFRVDGELQEIMTPQKSTHSAIVTRIKIMGNMNIAEHRVPQDGRVEINVDGREIDLRLSALPTVFGEKIVIRLLDRSGFLIERSSLGLSKENSNILDKIIKKPFGIILITGPTGSGKTTTLYTILKEINSIEKNIVTVEDPVEYKLDGINQVAVNNKAGMTFASALRAILRQDPDILMIGEIRDSETAKIAVRAAITGHLVLSTMHTNDTASTVTRLMDMGIEPYLVSSSVVGVVAQRLVRKLCTECKEAYKATEYESTILGVKEATLYKSAGCKYCNTTGYKGRTGIHEVMAVDKDIRSIIDRKGTLDEIRNTSMDNGTKELREACIDMVLRGITSMDELLRVTYNFD